MSEKELVIKAQKGDVDAFCTLYGIYKNKLYNYAVYKLGNMEDAEDAVQNCVLSAYEQIGKLKKPDAFSSWIFRILYCSCAFYVKDQIQKRKTDDIDHYNDLSSKNAEEFVVSQELNDALNKLSDDDKNIVLLSVVAGLRSKEIAQITGFTSVNVRQKLSRSLAKMKKELV